MRECASLRLGGFGVKGCGAGLAEAPAPLPYIKTATLARCPRATRVFSFFPLRAVIALSPRVRLLAAEACLQNRVPPPEA